MPGAYDHRMTTAPLLPLNDGTDLPAIALGTYKLNGPDGVSAMTSAIRQGYRLLDTAFSYENEGAVGRAVRDSGVPRDELVLTSKVPGRHQEYEATVRTVHEGLYRAGLDRWDLYLVHWPNPGRGLFVECFQALVDLQKDGFIRTVGVSNFLPEHLEAVAEATGVMPAVNQIELHPYFPQADALEAHARLGVLTEAWSPIGRANACLAEPAVQAAAAAHGVTPVQVVLRWHTQRGVVPLPRSSNPGRQHENLDVFGFTLSDDEVAAITALGRPDGRLKGQDPAVYEEL